MDPRPERLGGAQDTAGAAECIDSLTLASGWSSHWIKCTLLIDKCQCSYPPRLLPSFQGRRPTTGAYVFPTCPARGPIQARILERLDLNQRAAELAFGPSSPARSLLRQGGWSLVVRLPEGEDDEELALRLLVDDHVVVQPGYFYDFAEGEHLVISLLPPADEFAAGVRRVARRIEARASGRRRQE